MSYSVEDILEHFNTYRRDARVKLRLSQETLNAAHPSADGREITEFEICDIEVVTDDDGQAVYLEGSL